MASRKRRNRRAMKLMRRCIREAAKSHTVKSVTKLFGRSDVENLALLADCRRGRKLIRQVLVRERERLFRKLQSAGSR